MEPVRKVWISFPPPSFRKDRRTREGRPLSEQPSPAWRGIGFSDVLDDVSFFMDRSQSATYFHAVTL